MTAATATPQLMRDRLLQAIDGQSNQICNMVAVMEVISYLEKYPITKEALEETRLGKLINDVRKKTKNEDLAKRAKKLLRNWQKLIEPGQNEALPKGHTGNTGSSSGGVHVGKADLSTSAPTPPSARAAPELKNRNDFNNSPKIEQSSGRKRKCEQKEGQHLQAKMAKTSAFDKSHKALLPSNGIGGGSGALTDVSYSSVHQPSDKEAAHQPDADRMNKIPVNTVRPHPSSLGFNRAPSTSALLKTSVLQQHARLDQMASGGQCQPRSPRCSSHSPRTPKQEGGAKQTAAKTAAASSPGGVPLSMEGSGLGPSPLPSPQPLNACVQGSHTDGLWSADAASKPANSRHSLSASVIKDEGGLEVDGTVDNTERKKKKKYRPKDYVVNLDGQAVDDGTKPVRLKDRRLTFDHATGQIKSCLSKESCPEDEVVRPASAPDTTTTEVQKQNPPVLPSPFQQTNWKELSRNDIIQSYLSQQSSVLTTSGARAPGALFFMNEYLKKEELHIKEASRKMHVLASDHVAATDLPGVTREVTTEDLSKLHTNHWPGVNGCYDTKEHWYDWTECISLDPHGDESRLNILPYVCFE